MQQEHQVFKKNMVLICISFVHSVVICSHLRVKLPLRGGSTNDNIDIRNIQHILRVFLVCVRGLRISLVGCNNGAKVETFLK